MLVLIRPKTHEIVAELLPGKEIVIRDSWILSHITAHGITTKSEFKKKYNYKMIIYPSDDKALFALAFQDCAFNHGLQQQGYFWREQTEFDCPPEQPVKKHVKEVRKSKIDKQAIVLTQKTSDMKLSDKTI